MTETDSIMAVRSGIEGHEEIIRALARDMGPGMARTWLGVAVQNFKVAVRSLDRAMEEMEKEGQDN